ncbi:hypothetical protein EOB36_03655 [Mesorhizobium sp. M6A.T.Cr.TU.017.01.1.1]|uniref:hypothetical protein n=1 Tax=Mesorhizobium sp. M6A.T.Cr.TU.017.01.1.1 TaxID=2496774 RepID=UPI000FD21261|nr:hypothetical protein [Mesorhizobium sp. M6A.T.Cr.TU.017.01.1.1]RUV04137.1 hypothetical protein EOB36_03655 [Mesorhizobium sp. M6A.T.Cr.TU.017.01.1.1]
MSLSASIAPHLPCLRRFATVSSGSQESGDAQICALLEAIIADVSIFPPASSARVALYNVFTKFTSSATVKMRDWDPNPADGLPHFDIMRTPLVHRQALLLVEFEGFSVVEAAEVLAVSERQLAELLTQAKEDIFGSAANSTHINHDGTDNPRTVITALEATAMA